MASLEVPSLRAAPFFRYIIGIVSKRMDVALMSFLLHSMVLLLYSPDQNVHKCQIRLASPQYQWQEEGGITAGSTLARERCSKYPNINPIMAAKPPTTVLTVMGTICLEALLASPLAAGALPVELAEELSVVVDDAVGTVNWLVVDNGSEVGV